MNTDEKKSVRVRADHGISRVMEDVLGCKWTVVVLQHIARGTVRPGAIARDIPGLTPKVLNERLRKLQRFSLVSRESFDELPPRVEYRLTPLGMRIAAVLSELEKIEAELPER